MSCEWFVSRDLFTQSLYTFLSACARVMCSCIFLAAYNVSSSETVSKTLFRSFSHVAHTSSLALAILICGRHWLQLLQNVEYRTCRSFGQLWIYFPWTSFFVVSDGMNMGWVSSLPFGAAGVVTQSNPHNKRWTVQLT